VSDNAKPHRRLSARENRRPEPEPGPFEGVPGHLQNFFIQLAVSGLGEVVDYATLEKVIAPSAIAALRMAWHDYDSQIPADPRTFQAALQRNPEFLLDTVDWLFKEGKLQGQVAPTNRVLASGASVYRAAHAIGLVRDVEPETLEAAQTLVESGMPGAQHFKRAWGFIYGRNPDYREGLGAAVEALEAAAKRWTLPNDKGFTLGRLIGAMKGSPGDFVVPAGGSDAEQAVRDMAAALSVVWGFQCRWRHGEPDTEGLQPAEAETKSVLLIAMGLLETLQWGLVRHRNVAPEPSEG